MTIAFQTSGTISRKPKPKPKSDLDDARKAGRTAADRGYARESSYADDTPEAEAWLQEYDKTVDANRDLNSNNGHAGAKKNRTDPEVKEFRQQFDSAGEILDIPLDQIDDEGNPRQVFDEAKLKELAESIVDQGILQPPPVWRGEDGRFKLVDGGRRLKAARLAGLKSIPCYVRPRPSPVQQGLARLVANFQRDDLNAIERARAFHQALLPIDQGGLGLNQTELATRLQMMQPTIANALRLLELPEVWHAYVIDGRASATAIRDGLLCHLQVGEPILIEAEETLRNATHTQPPYGAQVLSWAVGRALDAMAAEICDWVDVEKKLLKSLSKEKRAELRIIEVGKRLYALEQERWEKLVEDAEKKRIARQTTAVEKAEGPVHNGKTPAQKKESAKKQAEIVNKRLFRYLVAWHQKQIASRIPQATPSQLLRFLLHFATVSEGSQGRNEEFGSVVGRHGGKVSKAKSMYSSICDAWPTAASVKDITALTRSVLQLWVMHSAEGYRSDMKHGVVLAIAEDLGVDPADQWEPEREFLELLTTDQLRQVAAEWRLQPAAAKRADLLDEIVRTAKKSSKFPAILAGVKPVDIH